MEEASSDYRWNRRHDVLRRVKISALYHRERERVFSLLDRWSKVAALVSGSGAFAAAVGSDVQPWLLATVALTSALSVVFGFAERARQHADLASKWSLLEALILKAGEHDFTDADLDDWDSRRAELEATEPPHSRALVKEIQNRIALSEGRKQDVDPLEACERVRAWLGI